MSCLDSSPAFDIINFILLEKILDSTGKSFHIIILVLLHLSPVDLDIISSDSKLFVPMDKFMIFRGSI